MCLIKIILLKNIEFKFYYVQNSNKGLIITNIMTSNKTILQLLHLLMQLYNHH